MLAVRIEEIDDGRHLVGAILVHPHVRGPGGLRSEVVRRTAARLEEACEVKTVAAITAVAQRLRER